MTSQAVKSTGADLGEGAGGAYPPPPEMTCGFLIQLVFCKKKNKKPMWLVSQLRHSLVVHPLLKKILDPPLKDVIRTHVCVGGYTHGQLRAGDSGANWLNV